MTRLVCLFASLFYCIVVQASVSEEYLSARSKILSLPGPERADALQTSVFDTDTVQGRYFYHSVLVIDSQPAEQSELSTDDLRALKNELPELYYEQQIITISRAQKPVKETLRQLYQIRQAAEQQQFVRVARLASKHIVSILSDNGNWMSAIIEIHQLSQVAPPFPVTYDYSLFSMHTDMAFSMYALRNYQEQLTYCDKLDLQLRASAASDAQLYASAYTCRVDAYIGMQDTQQASRALDSLKQLAASTDSATIKLYSSMRQAGLEYARKNYADTFTHAKKAAELIEQLQAENKRYAFIIYMLMSAAQLEMGNIESAARYLTIMDDSRQGVRSKSVFENEALIIKARVAESLRQYDKAAEYYEKTISALAGKGGKTVNDIHLNALTRELDEKHLSYLKLQSQLHKTKSDNMTLLAVFTSVLAIASGLLVWRLFRHKRQLESFAQIDTLTGVSNRWYALQKISRQLGALKKSRSICVAMVDIDNFKSINDDYGHSKGDKVLMDFARQFKYRFGKDDVVGRYGGEEFIIMMNNTNLQDATQKIEQARQTLLQDNNRLSSAGLAIEFSCGLVQVLHKTDMTPVLSLCDSLLYRAKKEGKSRTYSRVFTAE
ncbi:sensor domain-containing diguanylate cyclase [Salinimonas lutimaris]|uniref:sensor domain-containing diguanylate cyclase n=1 Tax=Salinimonas lutimaris TaxID=914153 RepID=UPI0010C011D3|nr:GGDEF domain-containing protein [Salinimonas lutimaris]